MLRGAAVPAFARVIGPGANRESDPLALAAGALLIATMLLALQSALGLVFDPRYRDFPFAPLTVSVVPFVMHHLTVKRASGARAAAECAGAALLALSVPYIAINENVQQLAVALALRRLCRARRHSGAGARRAKLSTSTPAASDAS